jgi:catechol 2,3-dioxygenase-like lactoylglutathione lyase family enzyme
MMSALKIDHLSLLVGSEEASTPYYDALLPMLGLRKERPGVWTNGEGFYFQFREAEAGTRPYEQYGAGMNHIGFEAPDWETVVRIRDGMAAAGFPVPDIKRLGGASALFMKDPDGIRFEITYYPPGMSVVD